ncbi:MAG: hypothetical protein WBQ17_16330 [Rhizomicrobium sp.]
MSELRATSALAHRRSGPDAVSVLTPALAIREVEGLALFHLTADLVRHRDLEAALGFALPSPGAPGGSDVVAIWQTPTDILLAGPRDALAPKIAALRAKLANAAALLDDVTHAMTVIDLEGAAAQIVCPPRNGTSNVGRFADLRLTQLFLKRDHVRLFVDYPDADYLWSWLEARLPPLNAP